MKTAEEYIIKNRSFMIEYEQRVRDWLRKDDEYNIADLIPFYRDGVTNPNVWFAEGNLFRPLFILKEVSIGKDQVEDLNQYLEEWGHQKHFEFVENDFDDIKIGSFSQWRRIAHLAKGFEAVANRTPIPEYGSFDLSYQEGGKKYTGNIPGYLDPQYAAVTANKIYNDIINKIAILEIKKIGGGTTAGTPISKATKYFNEHVKPFEDLLIRQIELIEPTVIVCLGRHNGACISELLTNVKAKYNHIPWIEGYHHKYSSNENFYYTPLKKYQEYLSK